MPEDGTAIGSTKAVTSSAASQTHWCPRGTHAAEFDALLRAPAGALQTVQCRHMRNPNTPYASLSCTGPERSSRCTAAWRHQLRGCSLAHAAQLAPADCNSAAPSPCAGAAHVGTRAARVHRSDAGREATRVATVAVAFQREQRCRTLLHMLRICSMQSACMQAQQYNAMQAATLQSSLTGVMMTYMHVHRGRKRASPPELAAAHCTFAIHYKFEDLSDACARR